MPVTYQATFGTVGAIHASDSLKHERGVSPGQTCGFRSQAIPQDRAGAWQLPSSSSQT